MQSDIVNAGIHPQVRVASECFTPEEQNILKKISNEWYVTTCGDFWLGPSEERSSKYRYMLIKPTKPYQELFNLDRELVVILSDYLKFEPRTLDAVDFVIKKHQKLRIDKICCVIFSNDIQIENKVRDLLRSDEEAQIIIPINYHEYIANNEDFFLRNKFKSHFYSRDLFSFQGPLKKELYFFGRTELIYRLVNRHESGENSGLFGLRKSGKTSVIFGIKRALEEKDSIVVMVDCHDPAFHKRRWNESLWYLIYQSIEQSKVKINSPSEEKYTEKDASLLFKENIQKIKRVVGKKILLIFDEIESITFDISPSNHWDKDMDFVYFWQSLRSCYQNMNGDMTYLIVGTNPICIEKSKVHDKDNPIFMSIPLDYIESFDVPQTRDMVRKLGRIMGLKFDELNYGKLTEDYGGHPFLIRHVCSVINKISDTNRPVEISRTNYYKSAEIFDRDYSSYIEMILGVLEEYYKDEYEMLILLANGDIEYFNSLANDSPLYTNHLIGYGLIKKSGDNFEFRIESVRKHLLQKKKYKKLSLSKEEMVAEISERRNNLEPRIRQIIRTQLRSSFGEGEAKNKIISILSVNEKKKIALNGISYKECFDPNKNQIYFEDLRKIVTKEWDTFKHIFGPDLDSFNAFMKAISQYRIDAHSKDISDSEMKYVRVCFDSVEEMVNKHFE